MAEISQNSTALSSEETAKYSELRVNTDCSCYGLRTIVLENQWLRLVVLPEAGAKIWQITYKPCNTDLLWNNPLIPPTRLPAGSCYDDVWSGGWDELFPNDEVATIDGNAYPDHGELWTGEWIAETFEDAESVSAWLRYTTAIGAIQVEKTIRLRRGCPRIDFHHRFVNQGTVCFPFLWKLHPAMAVSPLHRIDFPKMKVVLEPAFPGSLGGAGDSGHWPIITTSLGDIDLRRVSPQDARKLYFFYGTQMEAGWCAITNTDTELACGLQFDSRIFRCCWLFATYGGWRNHNVAVLEPCTGYPLNFEAMKAAGRQRTLAPGEALETDVRFLVQEGLRSVVAIDASGNMIGEK
jgi:hypothetical protein